ncbi:dpt-1 [Pristionchus pacificus]|uniref:Dipeptidyl peptidase 3 n=1 Tax=Pristionchus pacificus TaxID=54126 RepID=A0A2A6BKJ8_PRIPA|nr:dpt-1 [Pristionchus pacificus]|eukprot:PDM66311.1 dpt-1 [Pristionchus pacificus]
MLLGHLAVRVPSAFLGTAYSFSRRPRINLLFARQSRSFGLAAAEKKVEDMDKVVDRSLHLLPNATPVVGLNCKAAFENLSPTERLYAHHLARASFEGSLIVFLQVSPESGGIFVLLHRLFSSESIEAVKEKALAAGFTEDEWQNFLVWTGSFYSNSGNYKGFGDSKFVPFLAPEKVQKMVSSSKAASIYPDLLSIYSAVERGIFSLDGRTAGLGFNDTGVSTYHSETVRKADSDLINRYMKEKNLEGWNTRLFKEEVNGKTILKIKFASTNVNVKDEDFEGVKVQLEKGDYAEILARTTAHLIKAGEYAATANQKAMINKYAEHFTSGEVNDHKDASRLWIKDVNPIVESYIGFIENYRDPAGVRSEFEGFVAAVNKETSKKFAHLVEKAEFILERLPWGKAYEKDTFLKPDFTALDIIAFGSSGIPAGINIPNYDDIRQNEGFKNVSLSNVISAMPKQKMNFISEEDENLIFEYNGKAFEVQVGLHELLGHGSGKLFQRNADGSFNFDKENTVDILTGGKVTSWYEPGETWGGLFGQLASAYEECRAEAVGYVLCCDADILRIFGHDGEFGQLIKYVNWLSEIRAGLLALEFYNADQQKWGQAHCWARYVLTKVVLEAGQGFVTIAETKDSEGGDDLSFKLDKTKIDTVGMPAVKEFLKKLQGYKSTADVKGATALFHKYGSVGPTELKWRDICIAKRKPRRIFVQPNTKLTADGQNVDLIVYPETTEGIISSFVDRYSSESICDLEKLWKADQKYFPAAYE